MTQTLLSVLGFFFSFLPAVYGAQATGNFEQEWAKLITTAKHEGRVVIAAGGEPSRDYRQLLGVFQKKFGLLAEMTTGSATTTVNRILAERQAGRFTVDLGLVAHNTSQRRGDPSGLANFIQLYVAPDAGPDWVRRFLFRTDVTYVEDRRLLETWLTQGRFPLHFPASSAEELLKLAQAGLPIKEGKIPTQSPGMRLGGSSCCIEVFDRAPHPNAAKLFLNWFLAKEGQTEINKIEGVTQASLREDIEFGNVHADGRRRRGVTYRFEEAEPWRGEAAIEAARQIQKWWEARRQGR